MLRLAAVTRERLEMRFLFRSVRVAIALLPAIVCVGCTTPYTPDFAGMSASYAQTVEQYQINSVLMNIDRAAGQRPLSFLDIPSITGTGSVTNAPTVAAVFSNAVPGVTGVLAGSLASVTPGWTLTVGNSFNFTQSSLDNATFWTGFLTPISLDTAKFFSRHHLPKALIFTLLIDSIEIKDPNGKAHFYYNNPELHSYHEFQEILHKLIRYGLDVDAVDIAVNNGPAKTEKELLDAYGKNYRSALMQSGIELRLLSGGNPKKYQPVKFTKSYQLCLKTNEYRNFAQLEFDKTLFCEDPGPIDFGGDKRKSSFSLVLRSTRDIFDFLGQVVYVQNRAKDPLLLTVTPFEAIASRKDGESRQHAILVVEKNAQGPHFAAVRSLDGNKYSIPTENNGYSTQVMNLVSQLLTLNKVSGSVPPSPAVLIK